MLELINIAKLTYLSDISWVYKYECQNFVIEFYKDEAGKNHIEQYAQKIKGVWIDLFQSHKEIMLMWKILDETEYRPVEEERNAPSWMIDNYSNNGVKESDFY